MTADAEDEARDVSLAGFIGLSFAGGPFGERALANAANVTSSGSTGIVTTLDAGGAGGPAAADAFGFLGNGV